MFQPLRPTPLHAPRPLPTDAPVLQAALTLRLPAIRAWLDASASTTNVTDEQLLNVLCAAMRVGANDPFHSSVALSLQAGFAPDYDLVKLLAEAAQFIPEAHRDVTRLWVIEHGLRLPCKDGDEIEWLSPAGEPRAGRVVASDNSFAAVAVEVASDSGHGSGHHVRVLMERIYANRTQSRYDPESPALGQSYEDAGAMAHANPGRASDGALTSTSPGVNLNDFKPHAVPSTTDGPVHAA